MYNYVSHEITFIFELHILCVQYKLVNLFLQQLRRSEQIQHRRLNALAILCDIVISHLHTLDLSILNHQGFCLSLVSDYVVLWVIQRKIIRIYGFRR